MDVNIMKYKRIKWNVLQEEKRSLSKFSSGGVHLIYRPGAQSRLIECLHYFPQPFRKIQNWSLKLGSFHKLCDSYPKIMPAFDAIYFESLTATLRMRNYEQMRHKFSVLNTTFTYAFGPFSKKFSSSHSVVFIGLGISLFEATVHKICI